MEVAMGALALFGSGSAAAAGTAAAGAASWAGIGSTALSVIQGVMTAGSVLSSLSGGNISNQEAQLQASAVDLQSREEAVRIRTEELQKIGAARVAFAGSGVSLASGDAVEGSLREQSGFEQELSRNSGAVKSAQIRLSGKGKMVGAMGDAAGSIANYALSLASRG